MWITSQKREPTHQSACKQCWKACGYSIAEKRQTGFYTRGQCKRMNYSTKNTPMRLCHQSRARIHRAKVFQGAALRRKTDMVLVCHSYYFSLPTDYITGAAISPVDNSSIDHFHKPVPAHRRSKAPRPCACGVRRLQTSHNHSQGNTMAGSDYRRTRISLGDVPPVEKK